MENAIKKAIEGGYMGGSGETYLIKLPEYAKCQIWLDPKFWHALGKSCGWGRDRIDIYEYCEGMAEKLEYPYQTIMHQFIDHLIAEKPINSFFEELLNKKEKIKCKITLSNQ